MHAMVGKTSRFCSWVGIAVNMAKSCISAIDYNTGRQVSTFGGITLDGRPFPAFPPHCAHKHLGVYITMTGDFRAEKDRVLEEIRMRLKALQE